MQPFREEILEDIYELLDLQIRLHKEYICNGAPECVLDEFDIITNRIRKNIEAEHGHNQTR